ncbi:hypothetical protein DTO96_102414 [Ephemeroptericola cinctiostellae]|uniref:Virulence-associated protein E-like domain-containing protein n=1 Tax=Ephemeroptericola cinctiostellae TaxID=2268024 RepID=A0A345DE71_9BURK|nr:VapE domain-containing protein [Ephemeroptericola cinctiostellae]AXF86659.1 hypothetical protein DTO96_102414 [Ephemeroptericola cinctiostellae]
MSHFENEPINFKGIARAALNQAESLLRQWLPSGVVNGGEYKSTNPTRSDRSPNSFSVNLHSGLWADFATGDKGCDLIDLYAYLNSVNNGKAAVDVAKLVGFTMGSQRSSHAKAAPAQAVSGGQNAVEPKRRGKWSAVVPVPDFALRGVPQRHFERGEPDVRWAYRDEAGDLLGFVCRFTTSGGGKEVLPLVFARNVDTAEQKWTWVQWVEPRPLYLAGLNLRAPVSLDLARTLLVVEGEKCADAAARYFADRGVDAYDVVSWSGGGNAVKKANWAQVAGYVKVVLWADRDLKHDKEGVLLKAHLQPGFKAMLDVGQALMSVAGACAAVGGISMVDVSGFAPDVDGYDVFDAIQDGMDVRQILGVTVPLAEALSLGQGQRDKAPKKGGASVGAADAGDGDGDGDVSAECRKLQRQLILSDKGNPRAVRENVFYCLSKLSDWRGVVVFDEFSNRVMKTKPTPFGTKAGEWTGADDLQLGLWLAENMNLVVPSGQVLVEGVSLTANKNRIHPPRDYLNGLKWDGLPRLDVWLMGAFGARELTRTDGEYLRLVGRKFMVAAVARIYEPGCQVDNMIVLEGEQGRGKSTAIRILFGDWFADTHLDLNNKDAMAQLDGVWGYEIGEMDAFSRAEATKVKGFITSRVDRYRAAFERRTEAHARSTVFIGTTNQDEYLKDPTGARRFWPVRVNDHIDFDWLRSERDQLWAEAVTHFKSGEAWHVTAEEQRDVFTPEQAAREVQDIWLEMVAKWLSSDEMAYKTSAGFTVSDVLKGAINYPPDKLGNAKQESTRIVAILKSLGFIKKRVSTGDENGYRGYLYLKPA